MEIVNKLIPLITVILSKEENMQFIAGFICGAIVSGLFTQFVLPMIWKPKQ